MSAWMDEDERVRVLGRLLASLPPDRVVSRAATWETLVESGHFHGVLPLIHAAWEPTALSAATSPAFAAACAREARNAIAADLAQRVAIARLLAALGENGVFPILLKGAALAYTHYDVPAWRPRSDVDLLVEVQDQARCAAVFASLGYRRLMQLPGRYVSSQETWRDADPPHLASVDLHWRVNNSPLLASLLDYAELDSRAVPVPGLGALARGPCVEDALLLAALHRTGSRDAPYHHGGRTQRGGDRLIWLVDFVQLVRGAETDVLLRMRSTLQAKGAGALLQDTISVLGTRLPDFAQSALPVLSSLVGDVRPSSRLSGYLAASPLKRRVMDFQALGSTRAWLGFLSEQLYPPLPYLQSRVEGRAGSSRLVLAVARVLRGSRRDG